MRRKLTRLGNSAGITLDKNLLRLLGLVERDGSEFVGDGEYHVIRESVDLDERTVTFRFPEPDDEEDRRREPATAD